MPRTGDLKCEPSREWLIENVKAKRRTLAAVASDLGISRQTLHRYLRAKQIVVGRKGRKGRAVLKIDEVELRRLYVDELWPSHKLGAKYGCQASSILRRLRGMGVRIRHHNDTKRGRPARNRVVADEAAIIAAYRQPLANVASVARALCLGEGVVARVLKENREPVKRGGQIRDYSGEANANWRPDLSAEERASRRNTARQADWRAQVYARDNHTCQKCGDASGGNLNAHHIQPHHANKALRWEVSNGITLCAPCHKAFHRAYGFKRADAAQLTEFLSVCAQKAA